MSLIETDAALLRPQTAIGGNATKRWLDVTLLLLALPVLLPVLAGIWALLAASGGQPFFKQTRIGRSGTRFTMWKFRTMVPNADEALRKLCAADPARATEWRVYQKLTDDPRITRVGRFLRRTSLDELPQVFNVLTGDMSLVGPRPFTTDQEALYRAAGGRSYYAMRPGLTGLWQVFGRSATTFADRVRFDERYAGSMSLRLDLWVMLRTVTVLTRGT